MTKQELITMIKQTPGLTLRKNKAGEYTSIKAEVRIKEPKFSDSKTYPVSMKGYSDASAWKINTTERVKSGKPIVKVSKGWTFKEAIDATDKDPDVGWSNSTSNWNEIGYQKALTAVDFFGKDKLLEDVDLQGIKDYKVHLKSLEKGRDGVGLKETTINKYLDALGKMLRLSFDVGRYSPDPAKRPPKIVKLDHDTSESNHRGFLFDLEQGINEEQDFYNVCKAQGSKFLELGKLVRIGALTGMRLQEILDLECYQVNLSRRTITLIGKKTKTKMRRSIAFNEECKQLLKYFMGNRIGKQLVVVSKHPAFLERDKKAKRTNGMHIWNAHKIDRYFARAKKAAGITDRELTFHSSRNTYILRGLESGIKPHIMQNIVGHRNIETTMSYVTTQVRLVSDDNLKSYEHDANTANAGI